MSWWGKTLGGGFGFAIGGPIGALIGALLGHTFDRGLDRFRESVNSALGAYERTQVVFFTATFSVMGHIAKADGRVTADEIRVAAAVMDQMLLSVEQKRA